MNIKTLQQAIATPLVADSAIAVHQGKNVKVFHLSAGGLFIQKLWSTKHLKGSDNPFSAVVFIGCGPTSTDVIVNDLPKSRDLKPNQFYWFQGWDLATNAPFIFKAGMHENCLMVGIGSDNPIRVTYYAVNGAENVKLDITAVADTPEIDIVVDTGAKRGTAIEVRNDKHDKDTAFWRSLSEQNNRTTEVRPLELLIPLLPVEQIQQIQTEYRNVVFKEHNGQQMVCIPYDVVYDTFVLRKQLESFGVNWYTDIVVRTVVA